MKQFYLVCSMLLALASCTSQDDALHPNLDFTRSTKTEEEVSRYQVSLRSATYFANKLQLEDGATRQIRRIDPVTKDADTLLYFVNFDAGKGWVVLSGDKRTEPILASATTGDIDLKSMGASAVWFNDLADRIYALKHSGRIDTLSTNYTMWSKIDTLTLGLRAKGANPQLKGKSQARILDKDDYPGEEGPEDTDYIDVLVDSKVEVLLNGAVGPLTKTEWGQSAPWNQYTPFWKNTLNHCPTGCVAVAGAQLLYYFHSLKNKPQASYTKIDGGGRVYSKNNRSISYAFGGASEDAWSRMAQRDAFDGERTEGTDLVSILMVHVGMCVDMDYGERASGAYDTALLQAYKWYGVSSEYANYDPNLIRASLDKSLPVNVSAYQERTKRFLLFSSYSHGHSWIIDGYREKKVCYTYTYERLPKFKRADDTEQILKGLSYDQGGEIMRVGTKPRTKYGKFERTDIDYSFYWKMNFGWDGVGNDGDYSTGSDGVWAAGGHTFQYEKKIIHNFSF